MALSPSASSEDLIAVIRHTLMADSAVSAIVGGRIRGSHLQDPDNRTVVYPMVILELEGGSTVGPSTYQESTLYLYAYERSSSGDALRLYDACHAALQQGLIRRDGIAIAGYCLETARPDYGWNETARAYFARGLWAVRAAYRSGQ